MTDTTPEGMPDERLEELMREAGIEAIEEADYRRGQDEEMTVSEAERLAAEHKYGRLCYQAGRAAGLADCASHAVSRLREALQSLDERLRACASKPITAAEAYDSFYQEVVAEALAESASPAKGKPDDAAIQVLIDYADGRIEHTNRGYCPDEIRHGARDSKCPVCRALIEATR